MGSRHETNRKARTESNRPPAAPDYFVERDGVRFAGMHLLIDMWGAAHLSDQEMIGEALAQAAGAAGADLLQLHLHTFTESGGISGVALLAESHISIHTWPERGFAAVDIFMCGACDPRDTLPVLKDIFKPRDFRVTEQRRGLSRVTGGWFTETLYPGYGQSIEIIDTLVQEKTDYQDLAIYQTPALGRVLVLDGIVQTTEVDEFYYHEMIAHLPILAHGDARRVLIIGGGDGGTLREVLKHPMIEHVSLVEIDARVVELSRRHLPGLSAGAFEDPRGRLVIADGAEFVAGTDERFDVIIIDSTDPVGPSLALFDDPFYRNCAKLLGERGILMRQAGVPFLQNEEYVAAYRKLGRVFADCAFALVAVPTYCGGHMALAWASNDPENKQRPALVIAARFRAAAIETRYYNPEIHVSAFALPAFMKAALG